MERDLRLILAMFAARRARKGIGASRFPAAQAEHAVDRQATQRRDLLGAAQALQAGDRRLHEVDRVLGPERLGEDVVDPGQLEHRAHAAAGDHAGSLGGRPDEHPRGIEAAENLVGDRRAVLRHREQVLLRVVDGLGDRERNLARLAVADADAVDLVADHDERGEREPPAALDHLGDAVDLNDAFLEVDAGGGDGSVGSCHRSNRV